VVFAIKEFMSFGVVTLKHKFFDGKDHNDKGAIKDMEKFLSQQFSTLDLR
jgi:exopolyphosphatase/guanosine-5'-triphosphate,3'-diphosphate pyrophosphatase